MDANKRSTTKRPNRTGKIGENNNEAEVDIEANMVQIENDRTEVTVETDTVKVRDNKTGDQAKIAPKNKMRKKNES